MYKKLCQSTEKYIQELRNAEKIADAIFRNEQELITDCEFEVPAIGDIYGLPFRGKADVLSSKVVDLKQRQEA